MSGQQTPPQGQAQVGYNGEMAFCDMVSKITGAPMEEAHDQLLKARDLYHGFLTNYANVCKEHQTGPMAPMLGAALLNLDILAINMRSTLPPGEEATEAFMGVWYELGQYLINHAACTEPYALDIRAQEEQARDTPLN